jgi:hypothetical protein
VEEPFVEELMMIGNVMATNHRYSINVDRELESRLVVLPRCAPLCALRAVPLCLWMGGWLGRLGRPFDRSPNPWVEFTLYFAQL